MHKDIQLVTLQSLNEHLGKHLAIRSCAPVNFYMMLKAAGYVDESPENFTAELLKRPELRNQNGDWLRPTLTKYLRQKYLADIVSWQFGWAPPHDIELMKKAGYIENEREITFFNEIVASSDLESLVKMGFAVMVTMQPGFGTPLNKNIHTTIVYRWHQDKVIVIDPDERNPIEEFGPKYVLHNMAPKGAGTIILPKN